MQIRTTVRSVAQTAGRAALLALVATATSLMTMTAQAASPSELEALEIRNSEPEVISVSTTPFAALASWTDFQRATGRSWVASWNVATGLPHRALPERYDVAAELGVVSSLASAEQRAATLDVTKIDRMSRAIYAELRNTYPGLPSDSDLVPAVIENRGGVWWVIYEQTLDGIVIEGARADFRFSDDGHLLFFGLSVLPSAEAAGAPLLSMQQAQTEALERLVADGLDRSQLETSRITGFIAPAVDETRRFTKAGPELSPHTVYLPVVSADGRSIDLYLTHVVRTEVAEPMARFVSYVDAVTGEVHQRHNEFYYIDVTGHSDSEVHEFTPFDPAVVYDLEHLRITVDGVGTVNTLSDGTFVLEAPDATPRTVTADLRGPYARTNDQAGAEPFFSTVATPGVPFEIRWDDTNSEPEERDAWYHANQVHDWQKSVDAAFTAIDYEMFVNVNVAGSCNAVWNGSSINFFREGGGCPNIGSLSTVVYHEYGHGTNQFSYAPLSPSGSQHEGMADFVSACVSDQPIVGHDFFGLGSDLRTCDNTRTWPAPECGGSSHCLGQVIAGALWHSRENLIASLGTAAGEALSDDLFHYARFGRDDTFEGYYFDLLAVDDDNGTLIDGTPHGLDIVAGFDQHNVGPGFILDVLHTALKDTEDDSNPYSIVATFSSMDVFDTGSPTLYYSTNAARGFTSVAMTPTANVQEFQADIPAQALGTEVSYYIEGSTSTMAITGTNPPGAPGTLNTFIVGIDVTAPTLVHENLIDKSYAVWPALVRAEADDNLGLAGVDLEWELNTVPQTTLGLSLLEGTSYEGTFGASVVEGDLVSYRLVATDLAGTPNSTLDPVAGLHTFNIVHDHADDMENGVQDWTHEIGTPGFVDQWHLSDQQNNTLGGMTSWKFGAEGLGNYADGADGVLFTPPILLGTSASLTFRHWIDAEQNNSATAWDGAVVEISTNGGSTWELITPDGGYTHTIVNNPASPFDPGYPCWSGTFGWRTADFDLSAYDGDLVQVRWRFGTDGAATEIGWFIDDVDLDPNATTVDVPGAGDLVTRTALFGSAPNPFRASNGTNIRFALAQADDRVTIEILDVTGRRVARLQDGALDAGLHSVSWSGRNENGEPVGSGVYFVRLHTASSGKTLTAKVLRVD